MKFKAIFCLFLFLFIPLLVIPQLSKKTVDSLVGVLSSNNVDSLKVRAANTIIKIVYRTDQDSVIRMSYRWLALAEKLKMQKQTASIWWHQAQCYKAKSKSDSSLFLHIKALKLRDAIGDREGVVDSYNGLGQTYYLILDYDNAIAEYKKGIEVAKSSGDKRGQASLVGNLAVCYHELKQYDKALSLKYEALELKKTLGNPDLYYAGLFNLGTAFITVKRYLSADSCFELCLAFAERTKDIEFIAMVSNNRGSVCNKLKKYEDAVRYFVKSIELAKKLNSTDLKRRSFVGLHDAYIGMGNYKEGYENYRKYQDIQDSLLTDNNLKQFKEMEVKYQGEKKEKEIELLNKDKVLQNTELAKRKNMIIFFALMLVLFVALSIVVIRNNIQRKKSNKLLMKLNHEIMEQKNEVEHQKNIVHEKNTEITDSIRYAKRLQQAILPPLSYLSERLPESFVLFKPKDIVAGDFYWADERDGLIFVAAADCTGHGVPGALVSVVCSNALNRTVNEFGVTDPGKILDRTTELVLETFARSGEEIRDGMDISLCGIDVKKRKIWWSGANNPLVYFKDNAIYEISANKQPIGKHDHFKPFVTHELELGKGDSIYLFTDGFADQFGGPKGKKLKYRQFTEMLIRSQKDPMENIQNYLLHEFDTWKGTFEQVDDVTVVGIRF